MNEPESVEVGLAAGRAAYPVGDRVVGRVALIPRPGAIGLFVDLGGPPTGFVDVLHLPQSDDEWPGVGTATEFEVLQHRPGQVRLWPLDARFRSSTAEFSTSELEWVLSRAAIPSGPK